MVPQSEVVYWYVGIQREHISKNPEVKDRFLKTLKDSPEDLVKELQNATPRVMQLASTHFRDGMQLDYENNFEGFCRVVINEFKRVFIT